MSLARCNHQLSDDVLDNHVRFIGTRALAITRLAAFSVSGKGADKRVSVSVTGN